jgi:hypothetical protein
MTREFSIAAFPMGHSEVSDTQEDFDANGAVRAHPAATEVKLKT